MTPLKTAKELWEALRNLGRSPEDRALAQKLHAELCALAAKGDDGAFAYLYELHHGAVLAAVYARGGSRTDAADAAAAAWASTLERCRSRELSLLKMPAYVRTAAVHHWLDNTKRDLRAPPTGGADDNRPAGPGARPDARLNARELTRQLEAALAAEAPWVRTAVHLHLSEGLGPAEIGERLDPRKSRGAVSMALLRFRIRLRELIDRGEAPSGIGEA